MVRDGRDVIASAIRERWGPTNYEDGLAWYRKRMIRNLTNGIALQDQLLTLSLEDLVIRKRDESIEKLLKFLGLENEKKFIEFFNNTMLESSITRGRWKKEAPDVKALNKAYADLVAEFKDIDSKVPL
jgi:hypothetical protein